ncbi:MAG: DNA polymerase III subunit alpha, partial [Anaerolineales bacterium]|nr:DNA polymerase III subunit alpha [Anaerolineales bacterium]
MSIAYLRTHSYYSLKRALPSPEELVGAAAAGGLQALALTDHGALIGAVGFRALCDGAGVQPIIGLVVPVAVELMRELARDELVLLARNPAGYRSLARLSTTLQAAPERERWQQHGLPWSEIQAAAEGVICLTGGQRGILWSLAAAGDRPGATRYLSRLGGTFAENAYLSLELHRPEDTAIASEINQLGSRFGLAAVAVQPVYQMKPAQRERLRLLAAIDHNCSLEEVPAEALAHRERPEVDYSWQTPEALAARFAAFPEALALTGTIATQCLDALPDGRPIWPALNLPAGQSPQDMLAAEATRGLARRYPPEPTSEAQARLQHELTAIGRFGYDPLFLILADVVRFAREQQIPVSTRGSVANSLVAYCLGITTVDPLHHDLLFERFLNPARQTMPDIDLDFCSRRRDEILAYIRATYGEDKVALVSTINTFQPRSALRETAKAYGIDPEKIDKWTKNLPRWWHPDPERREKPLLETVADGTETARERLAIEAAAELVGLPSHLGLHPGGVVVAPGAMTDYAPLHLSPKGYLATQFDHWDVERLGLVKIDILGIRALTVVDKTLALLRRRGVE